MVGKQAPAVPGNSTSGLGGVGSELDESDGPLEAVLVLQDRSVESTGNAVGVAFVADKGDGFTDGTDPPGVLVQLTLPARRSRAVDMSCSYLTNDVADIVVEAVELLDKLIRLAVRVVIAESISRVLDAVLEVGAGGGTLVSGIAGSRRADNGDLRVLGLDSVVEHDEAVLLVRVPASREASKPILVANLDVVQLERLGVTKSSALSTPLSVGRTLDEFNFVESIINERLKVLLGGNIAVQSETGPDANNDLKIHVLSPFEVLHHAKAVSLLVAPDTLETWTLLQGAESVLPVPVGVVLESLQHVTAGEAKEVGVHLGKGLCDIDAETVLAVLVCRGEQTDEVEVKGTALSTLGIKSDSEGVI